MNEEVKEVEQIQPQQEEQAPDPQASFREIREQNKQMAEELKQLRQQNSYVMSQMEQQIREHQTPAEPEFDLDQLPDDEFAEISHIKKARNKDNKKIQELERRQILADLRDEHPDFKKVVSQGNLNKLEKEDPYLAESILMNPSYEKQMRLAYNAIKRYGIYQEEKPPTEKDMVSAYNQAKPKGTAAVRSSQNKSALGQASAWSGRLTDTQKRYWFERAQKIANGEIVD